MSADLQRRCVVGNLVFPNIGYLLTRIDRHTKAHKRQLTGRIMDRMGGLEVITLLVESDQIFKAGMQSVTWADAPRLILATERGIPLQWTSVRTDQNTFSFAPCATLNPPRVAQRQVVASELVGKAPVSQADCPPSRPAPAVSSVKFSPFERGSASARSMDASFARPAPRPQLKPRVVKPAVQEIKLESDESAEHILYEIDRKKLDELQRSSSVNTNLTDSPVKNDKFMGSYDDFDLREDELMHMGHVDL